MEKTRYGIDAPKVIRNLLVIGIVLLLLALFLPPGSNPGVMTAIKSMLFFPAVFLILGGLLMIVYGKWGKFRQRERILNQHDWKGDETVLDVGTGLGLLMIGAAKRLDQGKSFGIDIFNAEDLSNNHIEQTKRNMELENVSGKTTILNENIIKTDFPDNYFDVVLSNLCLHNIYNKQDREQACKEIFRIMKPGAQAIISDFKHTSEYKNIFDSLGMRTERKGPYFFDTFPSLTIIKARKNHQ